MQHRRAGDRPTREADPSQYTGSVWGAFLAQAPPPSRLNVAQITFAPGARTAWHTHPLGQVLLAVSGTGYAQTDGQPAVELRPGDTLTIAPGERHWHGAAPDHVFVHVSMQQADSDGQQARWSDHVDDDRYTRATTRHA